MKKQEIIKKLKEIETETLLGKKDVVQVNKKITKIEKDRIKLHTLSKDLNDKYLTDTKKIRDKHNEALRLELEQTTKHKTYVKAFEKLKQKEIKLAQKENETYIEHNKVLSKYRKEQEAVFFNKFGIEAKENVGAIYVAIQQATVIEGEMTNFENSLDTLGVKYE